jgi:hypothetical protein
MGSKKLSTTPYKPSTNGSVERFHAFLAQSISHYVTNEHTDWDKHIDSMLFAYRTTPMDGMSMSPFEVIYGREPNRPIDNLLAQEGLVGVNSPQEHAAAVKRRQRTMFPIVVKARKERFERNKKAVGENKRVPVHEVGKRVYITYPKGTFRPIGGVTKFSEVNKGPYIVLEKMFGGLVYRVRPEPTGFTSNVSVQRMIPVTGVVVLNTDVDLPAPWHQWSAYERADRINDDTTLDVVVHRPQVAPPLPQQLGNQIEAARAHADVRPSQVDPIEIGRMQEDARPIQGEVDPSRIGTRPDRPDVGPIQRDGDAPQPRSDMIHPSRRRSDFDTSAHDARDTSEGRRRIGAPSLDVRTSVGDKGTLRRSERDRRR